MQEGIEFKLKDIFGWKKKLDNMQEGIESNLKDNNFGWKNVQ